MDWITEKRPINELYANHKNPRRLSKKDKEELEKSLHKFGVCEPIVINCDGSIIGGHQRVKLLKKLGHEQVDVCFPSEPLSEKEAEELNIRLNKNNGSFDYDILANQWEPDDLVEWGFTMEELHLECLPPGEEGEEKKETTSCTMTITFKEPEDLQEAENAISTIVDGYQGATYKVKVK